MTKPASLAVVDALKAVGCCLIVLHHLAFYGPMSDHADDLFPSVFDWLAQHARMAVQIFLVVGGYLAARSLVATGFGPGQGSVAPALAARQAALRMLDRFLRLALPLWVALLLALASNALADHWMDHRSISAWPTLLQALTHLLLLQDWAGHEALSAGIWYVAIDFQLFVLLAVMTALARTRAQPRRWLMGFSLLALGLSALVVNRWPAWDVGAPYFWCSYGLGVVLALGPRRREVLLAAVVVLAGYALEPRARLLVALATAMLLWAWILSQGRILPRVAPWCEALSRISYAVFLVHFPVSLVVNAAWTQFLPAHPLIQFLGVLTAFKLSLLSGWAFHEWTEKPLVGWAKSTGLRLVQRAANTVLQASGFRPR